MLDRRRLDEVVARAALKQAQAHEPLTELKIAQIYRRVFSTPEGQVVLADICYRLCGIGNGMWDRDPAVMAHKAARRDIGEQIAHYVIDPIVEEQPEVKA